MARVPRSAYALEPGIFHLIMRGNNGMIVFQDELDYQRYLSLLTHCKEKHCIKIYAYCLMNNHIHLLIETGRADGLPRFMHSLNFGYSLYHKGRHERVGHLWQGRYKSYVIEKEEYLSTCIQYIEANPVKAGLVSEPSAYPWSSYRSRTNGDGIALISILEGQA